MRLHLRMKKFLKEVKNNPGLLPKVLVIIFRFGNFAYYKVKLPIIRQFLIIIYRLFDLLFVKLTMILVEELKLDGDLKFITLTEFLLMKMQKLEKILFVEVK